MATPHAELEFLIAQAVEACDCRLWGVEFLPQGKQSVLRVYIDTDEGVDIGLCTQVSRQVSSILDVEDPVKGEYTLEVSSPGLDRPLFTLMHYRDSVGIMVSLRLVTAIDGRRNFTGLLSAVQGEEVVLQVDQDEYVLPYESIQKANVVPQF